MKKLLAFLLAMTLVFTSVAFAFADEEISGDAQICLTLGMLKGDGNGVTPEYLASTPNRLQTAVMFLRLKGLEETALAYTSDKNFADAAQVAWEGGRNIMAYLYNNPDLGWVGDGGNFNPTGVMSAQAYYKVMLETLGYKQNTATVMGDFLWANVLDFAAEHGLKAVADVDNFTVNDLATATVEALQATVKGAEVTLVESLVADGIVEEDTAIEVGLVETPLEKAIKAAEAAIAAIPAVDALTLDDEATVTAAADAIDAVIALDAEAVVEGADVVDAALAKITELQTAAAAAEELAAAKKTAEEAIAALANPVALENKEAVVAARALVAAAQELNAEVVIDNIDVLVAAEAKIVELEAAVAAEAAKLKVDSFTATNLQNVLVVFNKEIDEDTLTTTTVKLYKNTSTTNNFTTATYSLAADNKTLTISLNAGTATQNDSLHIIVDGVKTADGVAVEKYDNTITVMDTTLPTVVDVTATTSTTIDVTFSEPMNIVGASKVWDEIFIDGVKTYATIATGSLAYANKVTLTLATKLTVGSHTYKITGFRDWAGYLLTTREGAISVIEDKVAPVMLSAEVTAKDTITVVFDEPVNSATLALNNANFTATEAGGVVHQITAVSNPSGDKKTYECTLQAPVLSPAAIVDIEISYKNVADLEGNVVTTAKTLNIKAADDLVKPTVTATVDAVDNTIDLVYSERMDDASAKTAGNYKLYKDGVLQANTFGVTTTGTDTTQTKYTLTISSASDLSGAYTVKITGVKDDSIRANTIVANTELAVSFVDVKAPTIVTASATKEFKLNSSSKYSSLKVVVPYSENMDSTSALNLANYIVKFATGTDTVVSTLSGATAAFGADNKTVVITIPAEGTLDAADITITGVTATVAGDPAVVVKVLAVKDANSNVLAAANINSAITLTNFVSDGLALSSVKAIAKNQIQIKSAVAFTSIDPNGIKFTGATTTTDIAQQIVVAGVAFSTDMKTATLTLAADLKADATFDIAEGAATIENIKLVAISDTAIVNNLGQNLKKGTYNPATPNAFVVGGATTYAVSDYVAPSVVSITPGATADIIRVTFDEAIDLAAADTARLAAIANDITVIVNGTELDPSIGDYVVVADVDNNATFGIQILLDGVSAASETVTVKVNNSRYIFDNTNGSLANAFDTKAMASGTTVKELVLPTVTAMFGDGATAGTTTIAAGATKTITFSETLSATGKTAVETAIKADANIGDNDLTYTWSNNVLTIKNVTGGALIFAADVSATLEDTVGNTNAAQKVVDHE